MSIEDKTRHYYTLCRNATPHDTPTGTPHPTPHRQVTVVSKQKIVIIGINENLLTLRIVLHDFCLKAKHEEIRHTTENIHSGKIIEF